MEVTAWPLVAGGGVNVTLQFHWPIHTNRYRTLAGVSIFPKHAPLNKVGTEPAVFQSKVDHCTSIPRPGNGCIVKKKAAITQNRKKATQPYLLLQQMIQNQKAAGGKNAFGVKLMGTVLTVLSDIIHHLDDYGVVPTFYMHDNIYERVYLHVTLEVYYSLTALKKWKENN